MFELAESTDALLDHVTLRNERHGKEKVRAVTLRFKITGPNTLLDLLSPTLRHALYMRDDAQEVLPGVEPPTPLLRSKDITTVPVPQKLVEGATVHIEHGIDDDNEICLGGSKVDGFSIEAHDGGTVDLSLRVSSSDVSREEIGLIADKWTPNHMAQLQRVYTTITQDGIPATEFFPEQAVTVPQAGGEA